MTTSGFEVTKTSDLQEAAKGRRVHLSAYLGGLYANFHVDVVIGTPMSSQPDRVPPGAPAHRLSPSAIRGRIAV